MKIKIEDFIKSYFNKRVSLKSDFNEYRAEINNNNIASLQIISLIGTIIFFVLSFLSLPFVRVLELFIPYFILMIIFAFLCAFSRKWLNSQSKLLLPVIYSMLFSILFLSIIMGTVLGVSTNATTFLLFLLILPMFFIDKPLRVNIFISLMSCAFFVFAFIYKSGEIFSLDISNTIVVTVLSLVFNEMNFFRKMKEFSLTRMQNLEQKRINDFINAIPTGIGIFEIRNNKVYQTFMNDGFFRLVDDKKELRDKRSDGQFINSIFEEDRPKVQAAMKSVMMNEKDYVSVDCRTYTGNGDLKWVKFNSLVAQREENFILIYTSYANMDEEMKIRDELESSKSVLEQAVKSANMTIWEYDCINHRIIQTPRSIEKHGYSKIIENVPQFLLDDNYITEQSKDDFSKMFDDLLTKKVSVQGDFCVQSKNRSGQWWEHIVLTPVFDNSGKMIKALGTGIDVTHRKEKEQQYYQQTDIMSQNGAKNLIVKAQYNLTKRKLVYYSALRNDALELNNIQDYEELLKKLATVPTSEESRKTILNCFNRDRLFKDFEAGKTEGSIQYKRKFGKNASIYADLKYLISQEPLTNDIMFFIYIYDDTHRILEQKIIDQLGANEFEAIGVIDIETGQFTTENMCNEFQSILPYQGDDYYKQSLLIIDKFIANSDKEYVAQKLKLQNIIEFLENNNVYEFLYSANNSKNDFLRKKIQFQYIDNSKSSLLFICSDVTLIYKQEQEQLTKIQQALSKANKATQAKTEFLSRMSHDIRTPLNAILGTTILAKDEVDDPKAITEYLNTIGSSGQFLLGLINDILDINKIESGKIELREELCLVSDFKNSIEAAIRPLIDEKNIRFDFNMNCGYKAIKVDKLRHHQIFFNLLSNAVKYTPENGHIEFITMPIDAPEGKIGVRNIVRDNGIGMTKKYLSHIFEPFTRDTNAEINQIEGSGLGLAIVKNIVDTMGGKISVKSELGKGTEFIVDLYFTEGAIENVTDKKHSVPNEKLLNNKQILLVDDNKVNVSIAQKLLEKKGCIVTVAANGQEAVKKFSLSSENFFSAILMDIRMPVMDGLDATKAIRSLKKKDAKTIPIIAMTADAFLEDVDKTKEAGMNAHLSKPINPIKLYKALLDNIY